jgi:translation initiation factor IF-3
LNPAASRIRINEGIRVLQIRLIGAKGEQIGIVEAREGVRLAREAGLDLVEVAPLAKPPVCRILDFGKFLYALSKKEKESRRKHKTIEVKEIKLTSKIDEHDYQTKLAHARKFLQKGNKVKLTLFFRGREITHMNIGEKVIQRFTGDLQEWSTLERNDGLEGKAIHLYLAPKTGKKGGSTKSAETQNQ